MDIKDLLNQLIEKKGSDLHLIAGLTPAMRLDGNLTPMAELKPLSPEGTRDLIFSILTPEQEEYFDNNQENRYELDFAYGVSGLGRFRVNVRKQRGSVAASIRALSSEIPPLDSWVCPKL